MFLSWNVLLKKGRKEQTEDWHGNPLSLLGRGRGHVHLPGINVLRLLSLAISVEIVPNISLLFQTKAEMKGAVASECRGTKNDFYTFVTMANNRNLQRLTYNQKLEVRQVVKLCWKHIPRPFTVCCIMYKMGFSS